MCGAGALACANRVLKNKSMKIILLRTSCRSLTLKKLNWLRAHPRLIVPCGFFTGLAVGVIARGWMRWISRDPEFSWSGTIGIFIAFVLFFTVHSTLFLARQMAWSRGRLTVLRIVAIVFSLPLFGAAGSQMLPTVLLGALALWRNDWWRWVRLLLGVVSFIMPVIIAVDIGSDFGWGIATIGRVLLFLLIYSFVIVITEPTVAPLRDTATLLPTPVGD